MAEAKTDLGAIRERLRAGNLGDDDKKFLDVLLSQAEASGLGEELAGGRRVVAKLPFGMDVVK
ncbi:MAG: hypothetical protein V3S40_09995 [Kiloniellales bacterium]|jgi:hypothetical protein